MGKGKMGLLDVVAIVKELRAKLIGLRLANIYHLSSRCYLFKLSSSQSKQRLIVESGVRVHCTNYVRDHEALPNGFAVKLRKHLRMLRCEDIRQLGTDRVIDFTFGTSTSRAYHVIVELYAQGNIILTDSNYSIIMLLRTHQHSYDSLSNPLSQESQQAIAEANNDDDAMMDDENADEIEKRGSEKDNSAASQSQSAPAVDRVAVREVYPFHRAQQPTDAVTREMIVAIMKAQADKQRDEEEKTRLYEAEQEKIATEAAQRNDDEDDEPLPVIAQQKKGKKKGGGGNAPTKPQPKKRSRVKLPPLKAILATGLHFGSELIEHCLVRAKIDPNAPFDAQALKDDAIDRIVTAFAEAPGIMVRLSTEPMKGYVVAREEGGKTIEIKKPKPKKRNRGNTDAANEHDQPNASAQQPQQQASTTAAPSSTAVTASDSVSSATDALADASLVDNTERTSFSTADTATDNPAGTVQVYTEYLPLILAQHTQGDYASDKCQLAEFPSLDAALDEYYSKLEEQKEQVRLVKEKAAALQKIVRVKASHQNQLIALQNQLIENERKAQLIEINTGAVDAAIASVNVELARGTDWKELARIIREEKGKGNIIASMIAALKLETNQVILTLSEGLVHLQPTNNGATAKPEQRPVRVEIDLAQSAFNNAQYYYQTKKRQAVKADKTIDASAKALKAAERKTTQALNAVDVRARIQKQRKIYWWEKFHWFISSENYLVIGGKDAQQNEAIVKKHMDRYDAYVHADVHGASSVIVKNPTSSPIPPYTLAQAGLMCVCRSSAWKSKTPTDSYWVYPHQVSKTAPTGMFLATGSFMIRGKKNFIPRMPMVMGLGLLFKVDESCVAKHAGERAVRGGEEAVDETASDAAESKPTEKSTLHSAATEQVDEDFDVTAQFALGVRSSPQPSRAIVDHLSESESESDGEEEMKVRPTVPLPIDLYGQHGEEKNTEPTKKRMSAAEKRKAKKGSGVASELQQQPTLPKIAADDKEADEDSEEKSSKPVKAQSGKSARSDAAAGEKNGPAPRGKRNKLKKIAKKYGQQDEDDLELATSLLGLQNVAKKKKEIAEREKHARGQSRQQPESASGADQSDEEETLPKPSAPKLAASAMEDESAKICFHCKQRGHVFKHCPQNPANQTSTRADSVAVTLSGARRAAKAEDDAEIAALKDEEAIADADDDNASPLSLIDALTAKPLDDDLIEFAVPVCAPYITLTDYKYKVKLVTGTQKKGKLSEAAATIFVKQAERQPRQIDCIHGIREEEVGGVLLSNIKLSAPGMDTGAKRRK